MAMENFDSYIESLKNDKTFNFKDKHQNIVNNIKTMGKTAQTAAQKLSVLTRKQKDAVLEELVKVLQNEKNTIIEANKKDLEQFDILQKEEENKRNKNDDLKNKDPKYTPAMKSRLSLSDKNEKYFKSMIASIKSIITLDEISGTLTSNRKLTSGITLCQQYQPLGVMFMIYESRPNVTADAAALCIKSGNACILKGGKEALQSNKAIGSCIKKAFENVGLREVGGAVQIVESVDRWVTGAFLNLDDYIDVVVPRGGKGLTSVVSRESKIPVIYHLDGTCHVYVDEHADLRKAVAIILNSKTQSYGTCNTMESLVLHEKIREPLLKSLCPYLKEADRNKQPGGLNGKGIEIKTREPNIPYLLNTIKYPRELVTGFSEDDDYRKEHLAPTMTLVFVKSLQEAIAHIETYGSHHTDTIVTENHENAMHFRESVNSASVFHNMSTRFADGFEYGLGAEIGISTSKMNPRGPVGLEGLTSKKWIGVGDKKTGSIRGGFQSLGYFKIESLSDIKIEGEKESKN